MPKRRLNLTFQQDALTNGVTRNRQNLQGEGCIELTVNNTIDHGRATGPDRLVDDVSLYNCSRLDFHKITGSVDAPILTTFSSSATWRERRISRTTGARSGLETVE